MEPADHKRRMRRRSSRGSEDDNPILALKAQTANKGYQDRRLWLVLVIALLILFSNAFTRTFVHGLSILPHELGHTVAAWMLGNPAAPIISTMGFYTATVTTWLWFKLLVFGFWCFLVYQWNLLQRYLSLKSIVFLFLMLLMIFVPKIRDTVISFMGIGGEIFAAFVFCYWALSPHCQMALWKRYAYLVIGGALYVNVFLFTGKLCFDTAYIDLYLQGTGLDAMTNDLYKVELSTGISIKTQAVGLVGMALLSIFSLWRLCRLPESYFREYSEKIKKMSPFSNFLELKKKSKKIF